MARRHEYEALVKGAAEDRGALKAPEDMRPKARQESKKLVTGIEDSSKKTREKIDVRLKAMAQEDAALEALGKENPDLLVVINTQRVVLAEKIAGLQTELGDMEAPVRAKKLETRHQIRTELGKIAKTELGNMATMEHGMAYMSPDIARAVVPWIEEAVPQLKEYIITRYTHGEPLPVNMKRAIESALGRVSTKNLDTWRDELVARGISGSSLDALVQAKRQQIAPDEKIQALRTEWTIDRSSVASDPEALRFVAQIAMDEGALSSKRFAQIIGCGLAEKESSDRVRVFKPEILELLSEQTRFQEWEARFNDREESNKKESFFASDEERDEYGRLAFLFAYNESALTPDSVRTDKTAQGQKGFFAKLEGAKRKFIDQAKKAEKFEGILRGAKEKGEKEIQVERDGVLDQLAKQQRDVAEALVAWSDVQKKIERLRGTRERTVEQAQGVANLETPSFGVIDRDGGNALLVLQDAIQKAEAVVSHAEVDARMVSALISESQKIDKEMKAVFLAAREIPLPPEWNVHTLYEEGSTEKALLQEARFSYRDLSEAPTVLRQAAQEVISQLRLSRRNANTELQAAMHAAREKNYQAEAVMRKERTQVIKELEAMKSWSYTKIDQKNISTLERIQATVKKNETLVTEVISDYRRVREFYQRVVRDIEEELPQLRVERKNCGMLQLGKKKGLDIRISTLEEKVATLKETYQKEQEKGVYNQLIGARNTFVELAKPER